MESYFLKCLGIDRWTLRETNALVLPACYAYELQREGSSVGILFARAVHEDAPIAELLRKMITALKCEASGQWYPTQPDYSELADLRFVITLGEGFEVNEGLAHLHSHSPERLISEPKLKAETWKTLQAVFQFF